MHVKDVHCKHVILGGSSDNGYARLLEPYAGDEAARKRITMLKGPPFAAEMRSLIDKFGETSFSNVFRDTSLPDVSPHPAPVKLKSAESSWAEKAASVTATELDLVNGPQMPGAVGSSTSKDGISRNRLGQRIDTPLPSVPDSTLQLMLGTKICNYHHLGSRCPFESCAYVHGPKLYGEHLTARRRVARLSACKNGLGCADKDCFFGHRCPKDPDCTKTKCFFPVSMHNVDIQVVT